MRPARIAALCCVMEVPLLSLFGDILGTLTGPPQGRSRRISSNEQPAWNDGNFDMTRLAPGEVFEFPELTGPGVINHIWFTSHAGGVNEVNAITLRIYWDGRAEPGVEVPLGEFFAVGQGTPAVVESVPVQVSPTGSLSCYWRMPFAQSARIVISNDNADRASGLYWQVDWVALDALPPDTGYFHARYRQEYPARMGQDYLIADLQGSGQYVGTVMSVAMGQDGWFGEGDDYFYIDGETVPSLQGTGSEDYFNDAWGFRARVSTWFGQPRWQGWKAGDSGVCYRWHVLDPVQFTQSLKVTMEHKGNRDDPTEAWYIERPDYFNSVAFWYQTGRPAPWEPLPPWSERRVPWQDRHLVRTFRNAAITNAAGADPAQPVQVQTTGFFGGRPALFWPASAAHSRLELPFTIAEPGRYAVRLIALKAPSHGAFDIELDGSTALSAVDLAGAEEEESDLLLGTHLLAEGVHTLAFRSVASPFGTTGALAVEMLRLLKLPPEADRATKTHNEAHFIRLGIGRAVYAYRLAYDTLPASLEALIEAGIMEPRYLSDENGFPILCRRETDHLVVTSTGPDGWTHPFYGLDARR